MHAKFVNKIYTVSILKYNASHVKMRQFAMEIEQWYQSQGIEDLVAKLIIFFLVYIVKLALEEKTLSIYWEIAKKDMKAIYATIAQKTLVGDLINYAMNVLMKLQAFYFLWLQSL